MQKTMTVHKGDLTGAIPIQYAPQFGFNALVKCPDYKGEYEGEEVDLISIKECLKCRFFIGLIHGVEKDYINCKRVRVRKVKTGG